MNILISTVNDLSMYGVFGNKLDNILSEKLSSFSELLTRLVLLDDKRRYSLKEKLDRLLILAVNRLWYMDYVHYS